MSDLATDMIENISRWTDEKKKQIDKSARQIQQEMQVIVAVETPVEQTKLPKKRIIVHAGKGYKAVREEAKYQPGTMRQGWIKHTETKDDSKIYAVRNEKVPMTVHLANFPHEHYSHGKRTGQTTGQNPEWVTKVQEDAREKFGQEIEKILSK